jgi:ureidoacrylate peracid hydrolase
MPTNTLDLTRPVATPRPVTAVASPAPVRIDLSRTALVIVDMQRDFLDPNGWLPMSGVDPVPLRRIIPTVARLADALRAVAVPILWLNWGVRPDAANLPDPVLAKATAGGSRPSYGDPSPSGRGQVLVRDAWGAGIIDGLAPDPGDLIVHKHRLSGFCDNELDAVLRRRGIDTLLFAGINIDRCVFATLSDASFIGYGCILIEDATATSSPDFVREAVLYLVRLLYGATAQSSALLEGIEETGIRPAADLPRPTERNETAWN